MLAQRIDLDYGIFSLWNYVCTYHMEYGICQTGIAYYFSKEIFILRKGGVVVDLSELYI